MKINAYGYQLSLRSFCKITYFRLFCTHKEAKFHACTGADRVGNGDNVTVGVSFVCPRCRRSWCGDILACAPKNIAEIDVWNTEKLDPISAIKRAIKGIKNNIGYLPVNPVLELQQKILEKTIKKHVKESLDKSKKEAKENKNE